MQPEQKKVNEKNLRQLCWLRGYHGVTGLALRIGRHRTTVHRAAKYPARFQSTYKLLAKALL